MVVLVFKFWELFKNCWFWLQFMDYEFGFEWDYEFKTKVIDSASVHLAFLSTTYSFNLLKEKEFLCTFLFWISKKIYMVRVMGLGPKIFLVLYIFSCFKWLSYGYHKWLDPAKFCQSFLLKILPPGKIFTQRAKFYTVHMDSYVYFDQVFILKPLNCC